MRLLHKPQLVPPITTCPSFCHLISYAYLFVQTEILDFGYPQNSETGALKTFITQQGIKGQVRKTCLVSKCCEITGMYTQLLIGALVLTSS